MHCNNTNLKRGNKGTMVKELQTLLTTKKYYTGRIDGDFGSYTENALKNYQKQNGLKVDGIFGPVTCKKIHGVTTTTTVGDNTSKTITATTTQTNNYRGYTIFTNTRLCEKQVPDCAGQITPYHCACHAIKQALRRFGITKYSEKTIGGYAGTTTAGTGHAGIETAIAYIAKLEGITLKVEWKNFSDLGSTSKERWKKYGDLMTDDDKAVFHHELYKDYVGHYSQLKQVNTNSMMLLVQNSLGSRYGSGYCGYTESRPCSTQERYMRGISQKSVCIITKL